MIDIYAQLFRVGNAGDGGLLLGDIMDIDYSKLRPVMCTVLVILCCLGWNTLVAADKNEWKFETLVGQTLVITHDEGRDEYSVRIGDVTEKVSSCGDGEAYIFCFQSGSLDMAIPVEQPDLAAVWTIGGTQFSVTAVIDDLQLLGRRFGKVYLLSVKKDMSYYLPGSKKTKLFQVIYSYDAGLLAFSEYLEQTGAANSPMFFASDIPSIGAR
ncbi:MAG: hypothetical protein EPO31_06730 [Gammaproteobacteria bacterium]|nr:MAG: hypothetical protein EPO31_06730 [Gammaproteobacteria bacterium]